MSHSNAEGVSVNFTSISILSFAVVFVSLVLFSCIKGDYHPSKSGGHHTPAATEQHNADKH